MNLRVQCSHSCVISVGTLCCEMRKDTLQEFIQQPLGGITGRAEIFAAVSKSRWRSADLSLLLDGVCVHPGVALCPTALL